MTSAYSESVKFYDRMSALHEQLKNCEEEQYNLQEELGRLWNQSSPRPSELQVDKQVSFGTSHIHQNVDNSNEEERRKRRNQMILEKIRELEANASVFAARSEKLKVLRAEYEAIAKKFLANRGRYFGPSSVRHPSAYVPTPLKTTENLPVKTNCIDIGVNTDITGDVVSVSSSPIAPAAVAGIASLHYRVHGTEQVAQREEPHNCRIYNGRYEVDMEVDKLFSASRVLQQSNNIPKAAFSNGPEGRAPQQQDVQRADLFNNDKPKGIINGKPDFDDSMTEKLKHNTYFDMSTTSESELTSSKRPPRRNPVPINIIMDDTTQSDTFSMSIQLPFGRQEVPPQLLNMAITSESESLVDKNRQPNRHDLPDGPKHKATIKPKPMEGQPEHDTATPEKKNEDHGNANDLSEASLSLTTSPGDSVMDSVQNKTLDESLRLDPKPEMRRDSAEDVFKSSPPSEKVHARTEEPTKDTSYNQFPVTEGESAINLETTRSPPAQTQTPRSETNQQEHTLSTTKTTDFNAFMVPEKSTENNADKEDLKNTTFELESHWTEDQEAGKNNWIENHTPAIEKSSKDEMNHNKQSQQQNLVSNQGISTTTAQLRPKTAAVGVGATGGSAASRRMRIKLDYDSDSDPSEKVPPVASKVTTISGPGQDQSKPEEDDDFDDFFDI